MLPRKDDPREGYASTDPYIRLINRVDKERLESATWGLIEIVLDYPEDEDIHGFHAEEFEVRHGVADKMVEFLDNADTWAEPEIGVIELSEKER